MIKITLAKNALSGPLSVLSKVINSKGIFPILDNFLFEVKEGKVKVTTSDNETYLSSELTTTECEGEGTICIPAKSFLEGISNIPEQPITIAVDDLNISVAYQNGEFNIVGADGAEYPRPQAIEGKEVVFNGKDLAGGINSTLYAVATDELRPILCGVYLDMRESEVIFVSTDGHRLVSCHKQVNTDGMPSFVLPKKPAALVKAFAENEVEVKIMSDGKTAQFIGAGYKLTCRLVDGRFPNWETVIPKDNPFSMTLDRMSFLAAVKRVSVFAASSGIIRLDISASEMVVKGENPDFSVSAKETMPCQFNGEMAIGFKGANLVEMLSNLSGAEVTMKLSDPTKAGVIESDGIVMILMPMVLM